MGGFFLGGYFLSHLGSTEIRCASTVFLLLLLGIPFVEVGVVSFSFFSSEQNGVNLPASCG